MKRIAVWVFYGIGTLAIVYLALYAYAAFTGRAAAPPGDPIRIFRKPTGVELTCTPARTAARRALSAAVKPPQAFGGLRLRLRA
jgi:hypothetical protein